MRMLDRGKMKIQTISILIGGLMVAGCGPEGPTQQGRREDFEKAYFVFADWKTKTKREYDVKSAAEAYQILDVLRKGYLSKYLLPGGRDMVPEYFVIDFRKGASIEVEIGLLDDEKRWSKEARDLFKKYMKKSKVIGKLEPMDP